LMFIIAIFVGVSILQHYASLKSVYSQANEGGLHLQAAEKFLREQKFDLATQELLSAEESFNFFISWTALAKAVLSPARPAVSGLPIPAIMIVIPSDTGLNRTDTCPFLSLMNFLAKTNMSSRVLEKTLKI